MVSLAQSAQAKSPARGPGFEFTDGRPASELVGQTEADIVHLYVITQLAHVDGRIHETRRSKIGVAVLDPSQDVVGESIFQTGTRRPAVHRAVIVCGQRHAVRGIRSGKTAPSPACRSEDEQPVKRHTQSAAE